MRVGFLAAVVAFAAYAVASQWGDVSASLGRIEPLTLVGSLAAVLVGLVGSMLAYRALLADMGSPLPVPTAARIFFVGQLGKYLPGSLWPVVAQMEMGRDAGVPRRRSASAIALTILIYLGAGLLVGAVALPFASEEAGGYRWVVLLAPLFLLLLHPGVLNPLLARVLALARREPPEQPLTGRGTMTAFAWSVVSWLAFGLHVELLAVDLGAPAGRALPLAVGGFALAWSAGFLLIVAPAGAGAREVALVAILSPVLTTHDGTAVALVSRLLMTGGDVVTAGAAALTWRAGRRGRGAPALEPDDHRQVSGTRRVPR
ncbi:flippase-like domain-containing protein [Motilibacter sp. K478]|nr:flippase-like domain-containing protein [Motilibacter aurantiacus]